ncbi:shikimate dehydrogenase [Leptotrichia sp. OH3620_COT-345]|uniref:shikimate dehydrogenase n=1 Tax=Leptotrichia sp. OH3620_COT-345 TaxID=2491048 RepID=UPI000F6469A2|nr:shikimate dehydrogenase [Leptotrichia sp. OH3620_COT-345]RRD39130.1 shikimate dehydrogenase [Leptotrichia sp. OH3620_COT-345]
MEKFGLLGEKLGHSFSKEIHKIFFKITGKNAKYDLIEKKYNEIEELLDKVREGEYKGINITIPYKIEIMQYLDEISPEAKKIGAVNTVTVKNNKLTGENTDYFGFAKTLEKNRIEVKDKKILILGTGGAAKSVYSLLSDREAEHIYVATILENDIFKIRKYDRLLNYSEIRNIRSVDLVVNCTPVGMYPTINMSPLEGDNLIGTEYLIDLIYNPEETVLMKKYKEKGVKSANGLMMLVSQAIKSQEIWNNETYDEKISEEIYDRLAKKLYK